MLMRKCLLGMLILMLVIMMLILMLLNLNTSYADADTDLCIRIMSLLTFTVALTFFEHQKNILRAKYISLF